MNNEEEWRWIPGYEGMYMVSSFGRVRSHKRKIWRILIPSIVKEYYMLGLQINPLQKKGWCVHRLVCLAFIPNTNNKPCINHKDSNKLNNHVSNLEWCTPKENTHHMIQDPNKNQFLGKKNPKSKLTMNQVLKIRKSYKDRNAYKLAKQYGVTPRTIYLIYKHKIWKNLKEEVTNV